MQGQIGHVDTITYALSLRPPLLVVNDELRRMLSSALALADSNADRRSAILLSGLQCLNLLTSDIHRTEFFGA